MPLSKELIALSKQPWYPNVMKELGYEPVRHGHWVKKWNTFFKQDVWHCDVCEKGSPLKYNYCPNCGAKMATQESVGNALEALEE